MGGGTARGSEAQGQVGRGSPRQAWPPEPGLVHAPAANGCGITDAPGRSPRPRPTPAPLPPLRQEPGTYQPRRRSNATSQTLHRNRNLHLAVTPPSPTSSERRNPAQCVPLTRSIPAGPPALGGEVVFPLVSPLLVSSVTLMDMHSLQSTDREVADRQW